MIAIVCALTRDRIIGKEDKLPWHIPEDLKNFKRLTLGNTVVMGRKTHESIVGYLGGPLPDRNTIVISSTMDNQLDIDVCADIQNAILKAKTYGKDIFIIGGASIFEQTIDLVDTMYLSWVKEAHDGDTRFPEFDTDDWTITHREDHEQYELVIYKRKTA